jgi:hypothetical protein
MDVIYQGDMYNVLAVKKANKYIIVNKVTGIIEGEETKMPTAIGMAKALQGALLKIIKEDENERDTKAQGIN